MFPLGLEPASAASLEQISAVADVFSGFMLVPVSS